MTKFILRRLLLLIPILLGLTLLIFVFTRLLPGDPAQTILGERATAENMALVRASLGLDLPLSEQYLRYMGGLLQGDLGRSFITNRDVVNDFLQRFPATIELSLAAMFFAVTLGIPLGMFTAKRRGAWLDQLGTVVSLIGISIPIFFLGLMLKWLFAIQFPILPDSGRIDLIDFIIPRVTNFMVVDTLIAGDFQAFVDALRHLILPGLALGTIPLAIVMRITRASVIDVLNEDYVRTAHAKGLPSGMVDGRHVLRNALLPVVTVIGLQTGLLLGGAILTETIFAWGGVGRWIYDAVTSRDYQVIQSGVLMLALIFVIINLIVDVSYAFINPRIRHS
ncbi:MAG: ABC transporter permease [Chloroflexi bacterium]|nr:ABC transporter permease [Chloroflexota bacterium]MBA3795899.1 ABC transporter permease [Chloroflexota bacterium]